MCASTDGKDFDAYVCVAWDAPPDELQFALRIIPAALEQKFGFRLWLFARDAVPGKSTYWFEVFMHGQKGDE